jgi:hypothetical protein
MPPRPATARCVICDTLPPGELIELDLLIGDPLRWPRTIFDELGGPPAGGGLPASYRFFGQVEMAHQFLEKAGYTGARTFGQTAIRTHIRYDVAVLTIDPAELLARGLVGAGDKRAKSVPGSEALDPTAFLQFYDRGIKLGLHGLDLLQKKVEALVANDEEVPTALILKIVDTAKGLATSQAAIKAGGKRFGDEAADEDDGFRVGPGEASARIGHNRVRPVGEGGAMVPVRDEGPADRDTYNARAVEDGSPPLSGSR